MEWGFVWGRICKTYMGKHGNLRHIADICLIKIFKASNGHLLTRVGRLTLELLFLTQCVWNDKWMLTSMIPPLGILGIFNLRLMEYPTGAYSTFPTSSTIDISVAGRRHGLTLEDVQRIVSYCNFFTRFRLLNIGDWLANISPSHGLQDRVYPMQPGHQRKYNSLYVALPHIPWSVTLGWTSTTFSFL